MSLLAWSICCAWLTAAILVAAQRGRRGVREGRWPLARARLLSPTLYLFSGYLLVAALVTPISPGESVSPLLGLALALPVLWSLATLSAIGERRPARATALLLGVLHGGTVPAAAAIVLVFASPRFVPAWLRQ
ncbi:hypothetical protein [Chondromyces apiculatus]|uniref:Uncharacterized protein n=1 Tax=Chondromyces apiculatus DSM 436 TaxID=1192034 RepID=A0A017THN0_9BACT|nr:hypothetical protein [Chondromyces apiculatus]EYF08081.1 Hypothetical protein CAP_5841 [Chondromyces apiculatus DSM 436]